MRIRFECTSCQTALECPANLGGRTIVCPTCRNAIPVPPAVVGPGVVIGDFHLEDLMGRGPHGVVYRARQRAMDRAAAVKILSATLAADRDLASRLLGRWARAARLDHPALVPTYDAGVDEHVLFVAVACVRGMPVHEYLEFHGPFTEARALALGMRIADALAYAWRAGGLLHGNLKPSNILLDAALEPKLTDWGVSITAWVGEKPLPFDGAPFLSRFYTSPEVRAGAPVTPQADMYSLGAMLWTVLGGFAPHPDHPRGQPAGAPPSEPLSKPAPEVSELTTRFLARLMAHDPRDRWSSWEEVLAALRELIRSVQPASDELSAE